MLAVGGERPLGDIFDEGLGFVDSKLEEQFNEAARAAERSFRPAI
jgi:hypothetical protein